MAVTKKDLLFWVGIITAIWFALWGMVWVYYVALVIAYPFGVASFLIWRNIRADLKARNRFIPVILLAGFIFSLLSLITLLIYN